MTILVATDRSENSVAAIELAVRLADRLGDPLVVMTAVELWERDGSEILPTFEGNLEPSEHARKQAEDFLASVIPDREFNLRVAVGHPAADRIIEVAAEVDASMIVAGTSGQSRLTEAFFGSTISALARRSPRPVLAVPPDFGRPIDAILAPVDFSRCSAESLKLAGKLATQLGARLYVQHSAPFGVPTVAPPLAYLPESPGEVLKVAKDRLAAMVDDAGLTESTSSVWADLGPPHPDILRAVEDHGIDLIVMGTHGRKGLARFFLGSTAERILRDRTCPVLVVRHFEEAP